MFVSTSCSNFFKSQLQGKIRVLAVNVIHNYVVICCQSHWIQIFEDFFYSQCNFETNGINMCMMTNKRMNAVIESFVVIYLIVCMLFYFSQFPDLAVLR